MSGPPWEPSTAQVERLARLAYDVWYADALENPDSVGWSACSDTVRTSWREHVREWTAGGDSLLRPAHVAVLALAEQYAAEAEAAQILSDSLAALDTKLQRFADGLASIAGALRRLDPGDDGAARALTAGAAEDLRRELRAALGVMESE